MRRFTKDLETVREFIEEVPNLLRPVLADILGSANAHELRPALDQGLLTVVNLGEGMDSVLRSAMGQSHEGFADSLELWIRAVERR